MDLYIALLKFRPVEDGMEAYLDQLEKRSEPSSLYVYILRHFPDTSIQFTDFLTSDIWPRIAPGTPYALAPENTEQEVVILHEEDISKYPCRVTEEPLSTEESDKREICRTTALHSLERAKGFLVLCEDPETGNLQMNAFSTDPLLYTIIGQVNEWLKTLARESKGGFTLRNSSSHLN